MHAQEAENLKVMLDFQWGCILMAVMSGAAGWPGLLVEDDEEDYEDNGGGGWWWWFSG